MKFIDIGRCGACNHPTVKWPDWPRFWKKKLICTNCGREYSIGGFEIKGPNKCDHAESCPHHPDGVLCPCDVMSGYPVHKCKECVHRDVAEGAHPCRSCGTVNGWEKFDWMYEPLNDGK